MAAHIRNHMIQPVKRKNRHQVPITIGQAGTIQMPARFADFQNNRIIFPLIHRLRHLPDIVIRFPIPSAYDTPQPVKIVFINVALLPDNVTAVLAYYKRITQ